ncbi:extracellular solute-binding protein [Subdoligranulum sp. AM23-21AC]|uniref:ABC transporter substrate-binding protein n=1 Tax=Ruthenibacterium lactatiformans TaxID=1550024 RepID=UPI000E3F56D6|nr:extracellular solute-binding protein [Ruthenibacterium lactatiformans]RGC96979.1 extracellular solute-binding protein [Subdoligranulum sp. AM16-9]RGD16216.1 extracellular solute-binding protein [Subdoligranulum sp. AM23-21AC]
MLKAKKLLSLLVAGALAASMLTACAGSPASGTEGSTAGSTVSGETPPTVENKERVEITGMVQQSRNYAGLQAMVEKLEKEENIVIDFQVVPDDQFDNLLQMKVNSGEAPDLIVYQFPQLYSQVNPEEHFLPLDDCAWQSKVQAPELSTYNGKSYGFVFEASNGFQAMVYNKTVFEENGIEVPTTTEEMYAAADKLKAAGVTPFVLASDNWIPQIWMTSGFMRAIGVESEVQDMTKKILSNQAKFSDYPVLGDVVDEYLSFFPKGWFNEDYLTLDYDGALERLASGEAAMFMGATEIFSAIKTQYPDTDLGMFNPKFKYDNGDVIAVLPTSAGVAVNKDTENADAIMRVFDLWSTPEYCNLYFETKPGDPNFEGVDGRREDMDETVQKIYADYIDQGKTVTEFDQSFNDVQPLFANTLWQYFLEAPYKGDMTGAEVMERFQQDIAKYQTEKKVEGWT